MANLSLNSPKYLRRRQAYKLPELIVEPDKTTIVELKCKCGKEFKTEHGLKIHKGRYCGNLR